MAHSRSPSISSSPSSSSPSSTTYGGSMAQQGSQSPLVKTLCKVNTVFSYIWLVIQLLLLVAALTVLHFSTLMVTLSYCIYGYFRRHEFSSSFKKEIN